MRPKPALKIPDRCQPLLYLTLLVLFVIIIGLACRMPTGTEPNTTQVALDAQSTQLSLRETEIAIAENESAANPPEQETEPEVDLQGTLTAQQATQTALEAQATINAQQIAQEAITPEVQIDSQPEAPPPTAEPVSDLPDFETWMRSSASILLYEDMAGDFSVYRFIQRALDGMGLGYVDVRDALGNYKTQILSAGPGGQGWDLIISGKELRTSVQGEFYVYLNDALNLGSSVIIEEWDMDSIASGKISTILSRCGVEFQRDWINETLNEQLLYPINGTHPVHHTPNEGISLTNPSGYWNWTDLGDLMHLAPGSRANLIWGARTNQNSSYATAVVCLDGQLTIQSFSSHSYGEDRVERMWQNYVYNALLTRYNYLLSH